jgi:phage baseplate assembly protein W
MTHAPGPVIFTLDDIQRSATGILETNPDGVVRYRLLREVLCEPSNNPALIQAKNAALSSKWVRQLEEAQLPDGSWGRFHSQDTKKKTAFRTTEEAIERAFALGLEPSDEVLLHARQYILEVLHGDAQITDRYEHNEAWPLLVQFILAGRLAQLDPANKMLDSFWSYWVEVANQAFSSGSYRLEDEASVHLRLSGKHLPQGFLESQHALWILSSRRLASQLEHALIDWIWNKPDGIRYLRAPLSIPQPRLIGYWLRSMNIISQFSCWREICAHVMDQLWDQRDDQGMWDFGSQIAQSIDFPLSESWRQRENRKIDYSTCLLILMHRFFD